MLKGAPVELRLQADRLTVDDEPGHDPERPVIGLFAGGGEILR